MDFLQIFLHHFGLSSSTKGNGLPTYTDKKARAYSPRSAWGEMFDHADLEESDRPRIFTLYSERGKQEALVPLLVRH